MNVNIYCKNISDLKTEHMLHPAAPSRTITYFWNIGIDFEYNVQCTDSQYK